MSFSLVLCESFTLPKKCIFKCNKKKKRVDDLTYTILDDINQLLVDSNFQRSYICTHILNKLVQLTKSEYGLLMQVKPIQGHLELHTYAITNMAWNYSSKEFFSKYISDPLIFKNLNDILFGDVVFTKEVVVCNDYKKLKRKSLPKGHPPIKRFLGIPIVLGGKPIMVLGVCNKLNKYVKADAERVENLMTVLAYLFIDLHTT